MNGWRKSTRSTSQGSDCIETAAQRNAVAVRDSKDPEGGQLRVSQQAWRAFAEKLRSS